MRRLCWIRRQISSKSKSYPESMVVDTAGISMKASVHYPGMSVCLCHELSSSRGDEMDIQKSAEGIVGL